MERAIEVIKGMSSGCYREEPTEEQLVALIKKGDDQAFTTLLQNYLPLIYKKSMRFYSENLERDDFIQEGTIGLLDAVLHYNSEKKVSFSSFAALCIERKMITAVRASKGGKYRDPYANVSFDDVKVDIQVPSEMVLDPEIHFLDSEGYYSITKMMKEQLTEKEHQIFGLYLSGHSYQQIAQKVGMQLKAVDNALQRIRKKMRRAVIEASNNLIVEDKDDGNGTV